MSISKNDFLLNGKKPLNMKLSDFDYHLPEELIAQYPLKKRDESRLMVIHRQTGKIQHGCFKDLAQYLPAQSLLMINNSKVIPARLLGAKTRTQGKVEVFLLKAKGENQFEVLLKPFKKIKQGDVFEFPGGLKACLIDREASIVEFEGDDIESRIEKVGHIPLPPYIRRSDEPADRRRYQTVYAKRKGSVAAPTAGLHFTSTLMRDLKAQGHFFSPVTLHVNHGTFKPVEVENILAHPMHSEFYQISSQSIKQIQQQKAMKRTVVAVGTTSCRVLESFARTQQTQGETKLFLYPGESFDMVDALITNFHLPKSTLLILVAAFAGTDLIQKAYQEAIKARYRFYSYGDAMLLI